MAVDIRNALAERLGESPGGEQPSGRTARKPPGARIPQNSGEALTLISEFIERLISLVANSEPELADGLEDVLARVESLNKRLAGETNRQGRRNGRSGRSSQGGARETISEQDIEAVLGK